MKVMIAVEGTRGDVYPMLALARRLRAAGHGVRICAPPDFSREAEATGAEFASLGTSVRDFIQEGAAAVHGGGVAMLREMSRWGEIALANQFRVLPEAAADCDRVLGAGTILAGASAAELHGLPYRAVLYTPAVLPSAAHTPCLWPLQLRTPWLNRMLWRVARIMMNTLVGRDLDRFRSELGLGRVRDPFSHLVSERPVVAVDRLLAPMPDDCQYAWEQIRCLHPWSEDPLPVKIESFIEQGPAPVYIGFGSMPDPNPVATTRQLLEAIETLGCRAIISKGWAGLGDCALPSGVLAIDAVDHSSLFPRMAAVVHHGGSGTTHTAARAGVPQLIVPHVLDQYYFARRVADLGVGLAAPRPARLDVTRLVETLGALIENDHVAERARVLGSDLEALGGIEPDLERLLAAPDRVLSAPKALRSGFA